MSNYVPGTVLTAIRTRYPVPNDVQGKSFHLDADRVWRDINGDGLEFSDDVFDSYSEYIDVLPNSNFAQPAQQTQQSVNTASDTPDGWELVVNGENLRVFSKKSQISGSDSTHKDTLVDALTQGLNEVKSAYLSFEQAKSALEVAFAAAEERVREVLNG